MPHVSRRKVDSRALKKIANFLLVALTDIKDRKEMMLFANCFFTKTERVMLAKRLGIAYLLSLNVPEETIAEILGVGRPTVEKMRLIIRSDHEGYDVALKVLRKSEMFEEFKQVFTDILKYMDNPYKGIYRRAYGV